ncbi:zeta toxin family protein [Glutamicibacter sp.]|uniref:zeta toxin family protein n=1 Tax=Glutamicibacter sp. TaxID=1931995 RepID=UPI002B48F689|nr:zeta toxin family protein [Glutamicibacter sp.]HJX78090.1 zeta toxin family protein [Glutamicibacter sp.]
MTHEQEIERHRQTLRQLNADSRAALSGPQSTLSNPAYFETIPGVASRPTAEREVLHKKWISQVIELAGGGAEGGRAVVMAGPPGAGKGTVQKDILKLDGYVVCDPDIFKELILEHELDSGQLELLKSAQVKELEAAGEVFAPMDFSTQVHREAVMLRDLLQDELMSKNINFVLDTVLSSERAAEAIMEELDDSQYRYFVVSVQASEKLTQEGIRQRWEDGYRQFLDGESTLKGKIGGRPVPSEFARSVYGNDGVSVTEGTSRRLAERGSGVEGFQQYRRVEGRPHVLEKDLVTRDGMLISKAADRQRSAFLAHSSSVRPRGKSSGRGDSGIQR